MGLTSPLSYLSDAFSFYRISFYLICLNWCHSTNYISWTLSLTIMGLDTVPLVQLLSIVLW